MADAPSPAGGRPATAQDAADVATCLADAFAQDPLWGQWTLPDAATRPRDLARFMEFWAELAVRYPATRMTDGCGTIAVWLRPGEPELTPADEQRACELLDDLAGVRAGEVQAVLDQLEEHTPHDEPHYHLVWWATRREHAGRGLGTAMVRACLAQIDREHQPAYLESTNPVNIPLYEQLGFEARGTLGPPGGPVVTTMWRAAR